MIFFIKVYSSTPNSLSYNTVFLVNVFWPDYIPDEDCGVAEQSLKLKKKKKKTNPLPAFFTGISTGRNRTCNHASFNRFCDNHTHSQ